MLDRCEMGRNDNVFWAVEFGGMLGILFVFQARVLKAKVNSIVQGGRK